jgi:hypothetical protein
MQTLENGIQVFTNGDDYNLADDMETFGRTANVIINVSSQGQRDTLPGKFIGMTVRRLDFRGVLEYWKGGAADNWESERGVAYTPLWTGVADFGEGGSLTGTYWVSGDRVTVRAKAKFGDAPSKTPAEKMGTAPVYCPLPPGYPIAGSENGYLGGGSHVSAGVIRPLFIFAGSSTTASVWAPTIPVKTPGEAGYPGGNGDYMEFEINYQTSAV